MVENKAEIVFSSLGLKERKFFRVGFGARALIVSRGISLAVLSFLVKGGIKSFRHFSQTMFIEAGNFLSKQCLERGDERWGKNFSYWFVGKEGFGAGLKVIPVILFSRKEFQPSFQEKFFLLNDR